MSPCTFRELVDAGVLMFSDGYRTKRSELADQGFRILRVADVGDGLVSLDGADFVSEERQHAIGAKQARQGDLLLTTKGSIGRVAVVPDLGTEEVVYSPQLCFFRLSQDGPLMADYLRYWFKSDEAQRQIAMYAGNTDMAPYLSLRDIAALEIDLPPLHTQRAIAEVLGALDDKIAANRALISASDELIRAQVRRSPKKEVPLFGSSVTFTFGEPFQGAGFCAPGEGRPLIRIRDLKSHACQVWTREVRSRETSVRPGEVLVGMDAEFVPARWAGPVGLLNQRVLRASSDTLGSAVTWATLSPALDRIARSKSGTTVIHLNKTDLQREVLHVPTDATLPSLRPWLDSLWNRTTAAEQEIIRLARTRDELLPALMSGRITVKDAEGRVEKEV